MAANIEELCARHSKLKGDRSTWDSWWQELGEFVSPRKAEITTKQVWPNDQHERRLYDSTAVQANMVLSQGTLAYATPLEERWFTGEPPDDMDSEGARAWYARCSEIMAAGLKFVGQFTS